ncbi:hypothetical protein CPB86DRAFT_812935 [Serendipita vermifera]|nr:hypothetical protein CPB86DRAFT_812935 [Serendipita vermifera]
MCEERTDWYLRYLSHPYPPVSLLSDGGLWEITDDSPSSGCIIESNSNSYNFNPMDQLHPSASAPELFDFPCRGATVAPTQELAEGFAEAGITVQHTHEIRDEYVLADAQNRSFERYPREKVYRDYAETHQRLDEIGRLDEQGTRFMQHYAGNTSQSRSEVAKQYLDHLKENSGLPLIRRVARAGRRGEKDHFECGFPNCNRKAPPKTFLNLQKIASHILGHLDEKPWVCNNSKCGRKYRGLYELKRHCKKVNHERYFDGQSASADSYHDFQNVSSSGIICAQRPSTAYYGGDLAAPGAFTEPAPSSLSERYGPQRGVISAVDMNFGGQMPAAGGLNSNIPHHHLSQAAQSSGFLLTSSYEPSDTFNNHLIPDYTQGR